MRTLAGSIGTKVSFVRVRVLCSLISTMIQPSSKAEPPGGAFVFDLGEQKDGPPDECQPVMQPIAMMPCAVMRP